VSKYCLSILFSATFIRCSSITLEVLILLKMWTVNVTEFLLHSFSEDYVSLWFVLNFRHLENVEIKFIQNIYFRCNFPFCLREPKTFYSSEPLKSCLCLTGMRDLRTPSFDPTPEALLSGLCRYLEQFPVM
jgi:hypothetical protein